MKCDCPGDHYYDKWHSWRVIGRTAKMARLYCLRCRRSWLSSARYTQIMRKHVPERRGGMTDEDVLARIDDGSLIVKDDGSAVWSQQATKCVLLRVIERESSGSRYRFVEVTRAGKKKKIAIHRLVWMAANRRVVPDGFDVDHVDGRSDAIDNLRLLESSVNRACTSRTSATVPGESEF